MSAFFVTATGTDIGKTYVTAHLTRHLRQMGRQVSALKPVVSGIHEDALADSDPGVLLDALALPHAMVDQISPWRFAAPLSPDMAAAHEGRSIDFERLIAWCAERIRTSKGVTLIEGVGGVMVPLDDAHTVRDWMVALGIPVVLVTGTYLGALSHTLTALEVLAQARLRVMAVVLNESEVSPVPPEETAASLARFTAAPLTIMPRRASLSAGDADVAGLVRLLNL